MLGRFDGVLWRPGSGLPWDASTLGGATLHPSGTRACLALNDFHSGFNYLVERDLRSAFRTMTGTNSEAEAA